MFKLQLMYLGTETFRSFQRTLVQESSDYLLRMELIQLRLITHIHTKLRRRCTLTSVTALTKTSPKEMGVISLLLRYKQEK